MTDREVIRDSEKTDTGARDAAVAVPPEQKTGKTEPYVRVTGRRALAHVVDLVLIGLLFVALVGLFGTVWDISLGFFSDAGFAIGVWPVLGFLAAVALYYVLMEAYLGQTIGKMFFGIRVVREEDGLRPGLKAAAIRTVLRLVDGIFFYVVGLVAVLASPRRQRLGDMAARTLVVRRGR